MTQAERLLWQALRPLRQQGFTFRRQQIIGGFIADFYCHNARLVVEVDGGVHADQPEYDQERDAIIAAYDLQVLRIPNEDIHERLTETMRRVITACQIRQSGDAQGHKLDYC